MKNDFLYMKTKFLRPGLFVTLKYSNFATKYFRNNIVLVSYFPCKLAFYGADVSISYFIFALLYCIVMVPIEIKYLMTFLLLILSVISYIKFLLVVLVCHNILSSSTNLIFVSMTTFTSEFHF